MADVFESIRPISGWFLLGLVVLLAVVSEIGRYFGGRSRKREGSGADFHSGQLLSGMTVLLSFFLGFGFQAAYEHFETRRNFVVQEAEAIETAYMRSEYLPEPQRGRIQKLMRRYVDVQLQFADPGEYRKADAAAERIERALWKQAASLESYGGNQIFAGLFVESLNEVITWRDELRDAPIYERLPATILAVAVALEVLVVLLLGYSVGAAGKRVPLAVAVLILAMAGYLVLIVDLDHPYQRTFDVSEHALQQARRAISAAD